MADFSLLGFVEHLGRLTVEIEHGTHEALEKAAEIVEQEAKQEIGVYQDQAGHFVQWAELADATKEERSKLGYTENDPLLRKGDLRESIEHKIDGKVAYVGSDDPIAEYQELGTARIPPRSFLGGAAFRKAPEVAEVIGSRFVATLEGRQVFQGKIPIK